MTMDTIPGLLPGEVESYDPVARTCRVRIPGITDGSSILPEAIILAPIGDRGNAANSKDQTELRILPNDPVWLMFEAGDPRYPIIVGARLKRAGNPVDWRRWRHANIEMTADDHMIINAARVTWNVTGNVTEHIGGSRLTDIGSNETTTVSGNQSLNVSGSMASQAASSTHQASTHTLTAQTQIAGAITTTSGPGGAGATLQGPVTVNGNVAVNGGSITNDGVPVDKTHTHDENNVVGGPTDPPNP